MLENRSFVCCFIAFIIYMKIDFEHFCDRTITMKLTIFCFLIIQFFYFFSHEPYLPELFFSPYASDQYTNATVTEIGALIVILSVEYPYSLLVTGWDLFTDIPKCRLCLLWDVFEFRLFPLWITLTPIQYTIYILRV